MVHDEHHRHYGTGLRLASQRPSRAERHPAMTSRDVSPIPRHPSEFACIDLVNSAFADYLGKGAGFDRLPRQEWRAWFLRRHGIEVDPRHPVPIDQLAVLRDQLRTILRSWARTGSLTAHETGTLDGWVSKTVLRQRVSQLSGRPGLSVEPIDRDWIWAMARIAASAAELAGSGAPERLKVCANPDCSWMFYDHTLNRSQRFCSTSPCAAVVRVRRFRRGGNAMQLSPPAPTSHGSVTTPPPASRRSSGSSRRAFRRTSKDRTRDVRTLRCDTADQGERRARHARERGAACLRVRSLR